MFLKYKNYLNINEKKMASSAGQRQPVLQASWGQRFFLRHTAHLPPRKIIEIYTLINPACRHQFEISVCLFTFFLPRWMLMTPKSLTPITPLTPRQHFQLPPGHLHLGVLQTPLIDRKWAHCLPSQSYCSFCNFDVDWRLQHVPSNLNQKPRSHFQFPPSPLK